MASARETILARCVTSAKLIKGVETCERNLDDTADIQLPAIIVFDGNEEAADNRSARGLAANIIDALPIFEIHLGETPENVGTSANAWLEKLQNQLLSDEVLLGHCGKIPDAGVKYLGCETELSAGRNALIKITVSFSIRYFFKPSAF